MCLHNCNPTEECFILWDTWSKKSDSYDCRDTNAYKWNSFRFGYQSIGTLKWIAKKDDPANYSKIEYATEVPLFDSIKFNSPYLLNNETENIKDNKSFISQHIIDWVTNSIKTMVVESTYDTGKTKLILKILKEFGFKRVLFISYRQTLTNELYGNFSEQGVESYLNKIFNADKLICQIESLQKIYVKCLFVGEEKHVIPGQEVPDDYMFVDDFDEVPSYDLVILDEVESILNHFRSSTIIDKEGTFELMRSIIYNSKKVLALDGDFHNRSFCYLKSFGEITVLENQVKKNKRHFIFTNNRNDFDIQIDNDLQSKKNVVIVSMSSKIATHFADKYKSKYKTVLHCAKSDDADKERLKKVNEFWIEYQVVIYSPSVESGCNFDKEHFDKIYVVLSSKSTSPRGLMQMCSRVRKIKDTNIVVYLNNLPFKEKVNLYTYDEIKEYICDVYRDYFKRMPVLDPVANKMVFKYHFDLYADILVHNEVENSNKSTNLFVGNLIQRLTNKGHTYEYKEVKANVGNFKKDALLKNEILNAHDIEQVEFNKLLKKQLNNEATREDKILIERFMIKKDWKLNEVTDDFLKSFYGKNHVLHNLRFLLNKKVLDPYTLTWQNNYDVDFDKANKLDQIKMIREVINILGFDSPGDGTEVDKTTFQANIAKVKTDSELFVNVNKSQPLFQFGKVKISEVDTDKKFVGFINSLFSEWGIVVRSRRTSSSKKIDEKKITVHVSFYMLHYIGNIDKYI